MGLYGHYDHSHNHPVNKLLHMIAIPLGFSALITVWKRPRLAMVQVPAAFALAWLGHLIEGNKPAFLSNPVHVLVAPVWMARKLTRHEAPEPTEASAPKTKVQTHGAA